MNRYVASVVLACVSLAVSPRLLTSASNVSHAKGAVEILVDGTPQRLYAHQGRW